jgi:hypothetical protein
MHKYNNQDHSMMTALYPARNILGENHDLWTVNTDEEYHEEAKAAPATIDAEAEPKRPAYAEPPRVPKSGASELASTKRSAAASATTALSDTQSTK